MNDTKTPDNAWQAQTLFCDLALARRLEGAEARGGAGHVEAHAQVNPASGAKWIQMAGACAMYDGPASPVTQTFGLGMFQPATADDFDALEKFFHDRGAPVYHEVSPLADASVLELLNTRGYQPFEFTSVMFRPIGRGTIPVGATNENLTVRQLGREEQEVWARTAAAGWSEYTEIADQLPDLMQIMAARSDSLAFLAELDGRPVATGALVVHEGVALLAGASTIPAARKQGAQLALLHARLRAGAELGCDLAMMCAQPVGGASQRNAERNGFRIAYTRIKWRLPERPD